MVAGVSDLILVRYKDQLKHPRWQRRRLEILERDGFACVRCKNTEQQLQVHHKRYVPGKMAWEHADADLETLCSDCHEAEHNKPSVLAGIPDSIRADLSEAVRVGDRIAAQELTKKALAMVKA